MNMVQTSAEISILTCGDCIHDALQSINMILEDKTDGHEKYGILHLALIKLKLSEARQLLEKLE